MTRSARTAVLAGTMLGCALATACTASPQPSPPATPAASSSGATPGASAAPSAPTEEPEPTTTNTLPPPPAATTAPPSTAGRLDARSLPVPNGWRTTVLKDSDENGSRGNGTWVHARDPRYAAQDVITLGCADVTRDDYADPSNALEGNYRNDSGAPGVGLVLDFADQAAAAAYFGLYLRQVKACGPDAPVQTTIVSDSGGLIDRRTYPDSEWTEIAKQTGTAVTLVILSDPGHRMSRASAERVLAQIR